MLEAHESVFTVAIRQAVLAFANGRYRSTENPVVA